MQNYENQRVIVVFLLLQANAGKRLGERSRPERRGMLDDKSNIGNQKILRIYIEFFDHCRDTVRKGLVNAGIRAHSPRQQMLPGEAKKPGM